MEIMENKEFLELEKKVGSALDGGVNEFTIPISKMSKALKLLGFKLTNGSILESNANLKDENFPEFKTIWKKAREENLAVERIEKFKEKKRFSSLLKVAAVLVVLSGLGWGVVFSLPSIKIADISSLFQYNESSNSSNLAIPNNQAKILNLHGEAYLLNSDNSFRNSIKNFQYLHTGVKLLVEEDGFLDLQISEQVAIRVLGGSEVILQSLTETEHGDRFMLNLIKGMILSKVSRMKKNSEYTIRTEGGDVLVRGTRFATQVSGNRLKVAVSEGQVAFRRKTKDHDYIKEFSDIMILPQFEMEYKNGETTQTPLTMKFRRSLAELDYLAPEMSKDYKFIQSEDDLYRYYSILEKIEMDGGQLVGVVYDMDESHLYIRTVDGEKKIPQSKILNVEKIR